MENYIYTSIIAIIYALIRAKHDSYILNGKWKLWAFIEGIFVDVALVGALYQSWADLFLLPLFGLIFWLVFDIASGILRTKDPFHFGIGKFDQTMRKMFQWGELFVITKLFLIGLLTGIYFAFLI